MDRIMAEALAWAINGNVVPPDPGTTLWAVNLTREDGKFIHIDEDGGVIYEDERHGLVGDNPSQQCDTVQYEWDGSEDFAQGLACLLQGADWHTGGGNWVCLWVRPDGKVASIGADVACVYPSMDAFHNDDSEDAYEYRDFF